jgi:hypothetical protein
MTLGKHLKPKRASTPWERLYVQALTRARLLGDPRLITLEHWEGNPEYALRLLSILSITDLDREMPLLPSS